MIDKRLEEIFQSLGVVPGMWRQPVNRLPIASRHRAVMEWVFHGVLLARRQEKYFFQFGKRSLIYSCHCIHFCHP